MKTPSNLLLITFVYMALWTSDYVWAEDQNLIHIRNSSTKPLEIVVLFKRGVDNVEREFVDRWYLPPNKSCVISTNTSILLQNGAPVLQIRGRFASRPEYGPVDNKDGTVSQGFPITGGELLKNSTNYPYFWGTLDSGFEPFKTRKKGNKTTYYVTLGKIVG